MLTRCHRFPSRRNGQCQLYTGRVSAYGIVTGATTNGITLESGKAFTQRLACLPA